MPIYPLPWNRYMNPDGEACFSCVPWRFRAIRCTAWANVAQVIYTILPQTGWEGDARRKSHKRTISRLPSVRHLRTTVDSKYDTPFLYQPELSSRADCQVRFRVGTVSTYGRTVSACLSNHHSACNLSLRQMPAFKPQCLFGMAVSMSSPTGIFSKPSQERKTKSQRKNQQINNALF